VGGPSKPPGCGSRRCRNENLDLARALADAFNRRDWDAFVALADDGIEVESRLVGMEGAYRGREGLRRRPSKPPSCGSRPGASELEREGLERCAACCFLGIILFPFDPPSLRSHSDAPDMQGVAQDMERRGRSFGLDPSRLPVGARATGKPSRGGER
jgi:hypothetical protein